MNIDTKETTMHDRINRQYGTARRMSELSGPHDHGGADMIVQPQTGRIFRIRKRHFLAFATQAIEGDWGQGYKIIPRSQHAWEAEVVEWPLLRGESRPTTAVVNWDEQGWYLVGWTWTDENGFIVARPTGEELEPS